MVPEMVMLLLKFVMSVISDATIRVNVAGVDCPGLSWVPSPFQEMVIHPSASVGVQLFVVKLKVNVAVPVFFTYMVCVVLHPASIDPQSMLVRFSVHSLFE